ncbi:hypothetical protein [Bradyrhizobium sp. USDA 4504]
MPTYVARYLVTYNDTPPYEAHPDSYVNIAGYSIKSVGWSTAQDGIHKFELQGLVDIATIPSSEIYAHNSWDPVGTTFYGWATKFSISDPSQIPSQYYNPSFGTTGPGGMFSYTDAQHNEMMFGPVNYDFSTDIAGSVSLGSLTVSTKDTMYTLVENAAAAAGFSGLSTAIKNVVAAKNALEKVMTDGMQLLSDGIKGVGNPYFSHRGFDARVEQFMQGADDTFQQALIDQTLFPGNPTLEHYADNILNGIRLVGVAGQQGTIPLSAAVELVLRVEAGPAALEATFTGSATADVIIQPGGAATTINGGDGDDFIVAGSGNNWLIGGIGNDYLFGGRGNDILVAGPSSTVILDGGTALPGDYYNGGPGTDAAVFSAPLAAYHPTLAGFGNSYIWGSDGGTYTKSVELLQFADGVVSTVSNSPLVDNLFYDSKNLDVFHAAVDPTAHYASSGWREGRDPNPDFTTKGYLGANHDVSAAGINPLAHYDNFGWKEGRDPGKNFDTTLYLQHNPDVKAAGIDPLMHYLQYGQQEGRQAYAAIGSSITHGSFDAEYYLLSNPDVGASGMDPYTHYQKFGWHEGRNPNAYFDVKGYLKAYVDVAAAGFDPLAHYDNFGWKEMRDPSSWFDTQHYLQDYSDVAAAQIDPLTHYLKKGAYEGRFVYDDHTIGHSTPATSYFDFHL